MQCSADLYERICTLPFPPSFSYVCMHAWLGFSGGGAAAAAIIVDVVVFVFMEREEFKNKGRERGRLAR